MAEREVVLGSGDGDHLRNVRNNVIQPDELPGLTQQVFNALSQLPSKNLLHRPRLDSAVPVKKLWVACLRPAAASGRPPRPDTHADDDLEVSSGTEASTAGLFFVSPDDDRRTRLARGHQGGCAAASEPACAGFMACPRNP